ncbi:MAG: hypothetical protein IJ043_01080 [Clostridia bacterium]|nr:hypothetical protein [Clostridia bacterium]
MRDYFGKDQRFYFRFPLDGDCLNCYDGDETEEGLRIVVRIAAPSGIQLTVNQQTAEWDGECYTCPVILKNYRTTLEAVDTTTGESTAIVVYRLRDAVGKYRLSSDDNILFLQDLNDHPEYNSIFDNPYLAVYKKAHDLYGACVHMNIYYEYGPEEMKDFSAHKKPFDLSMMTDRYKNEWQQNAHWLRLSFHARKNYPDAPYRNSSIEEISGDIERVHREILRFAGEGVLSPVTTLHFGAANLQVTRTLREYGYRCLTGYFELDKHGEPLVAYHYPADFVCHVGERDFWKDNQEDLIFCRIDRVLNYPQDAAENIKALEEVAENDHRAGFISMMIHEEYFYPDYCNHRPRFEELVLEACRWCYERGYRGALLSDTVFE